MLCLSILNLFKDQLPEAIAISSPFVIKSFPIKVDASNLSFLAPALANVLSICVWSSNWNLLNKSSNKSEMS